MDLHPIVVHFPIALFTLYSVMEAFRYRRVTELPWWFPMKALLVILGTLAANSALLTGEMIAEQLKTSNALSSAVAVHEQWAKLTTGIYSILALAYLIVWIERSGVLNRLFPDPAGGFRRLFDRRISPVARMFIRSDFAVTLALLGLAAITITGALGGGMVHGPDVDPVARLVYDFFVGR
ncbi:MAG: hypothetical protein RL681_554 [Candidatus Parcubacteria bacterium]|jgi:hypothetical protein